jgi:Arc/MetJ-type ribon-helix-helix transcriptional regulator
MTINLPDDLERFIRVEVHCGQFPSEEDVIAEAVRLLRRQLGHRRKSIPAGGVAAFASTPDPVFGAMRERRPMS